MSRILLVRPAVHRWEVSPASVSTLEIDAGGARLVCVNETTDAAAP